MVLKVILCLSIGVVIAGLAVQLTLADEAIQTAYQLPAYQTFVPRI